MGNYQITGASAFNRNCVTGEHDHLYEYLKEAIAGATAIDMNVSFLMVSGVRLMLDDLKAAADSGVPIRILCADYLNITQPEALYLLRMPWVTGWISDSTTSPISPSMRKPIFSAIRIAKKSSSAPLIFPGPP